LFNAPANVAMPPMLLNTATVPSANFSVPDNAPGTITISTNYNTLTIGKNATVVITGNIYGKVQIKEGARVTITTPDISINDIAMDNGKSTNLSELFLNGIMARIKNKVVIGNHCRVIGNNNFIFYMGDLAPDAEKFTVNKTNTIVTANVFMPHGTLHVVGKTGPCTMTGTFICENISSDDLGVTWKGNSCYTPPPPANILTRNPKAYIPVLEPAIGLEVQVYPNPSPSDFVVRVKSASKAPVMLRVIDMNGHVLKTESNVQPGADKRIGAGLAAGTYFIEVIQGSERKVMKVIKIN